MCVSLWMPRYHTATARRHFSLQTCFSLARMPYTTPNATFLFSQSTVMDAPQRYSPPPPLPKKTYVVVDTEDDIKYRYYSSRGHFNKQTINMPSLGKEKNFYKHITISYHI